MHPLTRHSSPMGERVGAGGAAFAPCTSQKTLALRPEPVPHSDECTAAAPRTLSHMQQTMRPHRLKTTETILRISRHHA